MFPDAPLSTSTQIDVNGPNFASKTKDDKFLVSAEKVRQNENLGARRGFWTRELDMVDGGRRKNKKEKEI